MNHAMVLKVDFPNVDRPSEYPQLSDLGETSAATSRADVVPVPHYMFSSGILLRLRTVVFVTFAMSEPSGSVFSKRYATGSLTRISYQTPIPTGVPSSEFTARLRRYR